MSIVSRYLWVITLSLSISLGGPLAIAQQSTPEIKTPEAVSEITTSSIVQSALNCVDCIDWKIIGLCFWLVCTPGGCYVEESEKISHRMPDFVVTSYTNETPWVETQSYEEEPTATQSNENQDRVKDGYLDYKHVEVISNPAILIFKELAKNYDYFCDSTIDTPMLPYFLSQMDYNWRNPLIELLYPQSWTGWPRISTDLPNGYWAQLYPRCGWGAHPYDPINAAVAAYRASDIVSKENQPHVYQYAGDNCNPKCWPPTHNDNFFQMLAPIPEVTSKKFGGSAAWANGKAKFDERYAWNLWRRYKCCSPRGAFLFSIEFDSGD